MAFVFEDTQIQPKQRFVFEDEKPSRFVFEEKPSFFQKAKETIGTFAGDVAEGYKQILGTKPEPTYPEIPEIQKLKGVSALGKPKVSTEGWEEGRAKPLTYETLGALEAAPTVASAIVTFLPKIGIGGYRAIADIIKEGKIDWDKVEKAQEKIPTYMPTTEWGKFLSELVALPYSYPREAITSLGQTPEQQKGLGFLYDTTMGALMAKGLIKKGGRVFEKIGEKIVEKGKVTLPSSVKIARATGKEQALPLLQKLPEEQRIKQQVNDAIKSKVDAAKAFEKKDPAYAEQLRREAIAEGEKIKVADGPTAEKAVKEALEGIEKPVLVKEPIVEKGLLEKQTIIGIKGQFAKTPEATIEDMNNSIFVDSIGTEFRTTVTKRDKEGKTYYELYTELYDVETGDFMNQSYQRKIYTDNPKYNLTPEDFYKLGIAEADGVATFQKGVLKGIKSTEAKVKLGLPIEPESIYKEIRQNEGIEAENLVRHLNKNGVITVDTHVRGDKVRVQIHADESMLDKIASTGAILEKRPSHVGIAETYNLIIPKDQIDKVIKEMKAKPAPLSEGKEVSNISNKKWFHGTSKDFVEFDISKSEGTQMMGKGFYFTNDPKSAANYSMTKGAEAPNIRVHKLDFKNPFVYEDMLKNPTIEAKQRAIEILKEEVRDVGTQVNQSLVRQMWDEIAKGKNPINYLGGENIGQLARDLGYDSIIHKWGKTNQEINVIVFDKSQIKSAWEVKTKLAERFVLEPTEPTEAKVKPTQSEILEEQFAPQGYTYDAQGNLKPVQMVGEGKPFAPKGYTYDKEGNLIKLPLGAEKEGLKGAIPSVELPEIALEKATREVETRKVEAEIAERQVGLPIEVYRVGTEKAYRPDTGTFYFKGTPTEKEIKDLSFYGDVHKTTISPQNVLKISEKEIQLYLSDPSQYLVKKWFPEINIKETPPSELDAIIAKEATKKGYDAINYGDRIIVDLSQIVERQIGPGAIVAGSLAYKTNLPKYAANINLERVDSPYAVKKMILDISDRYASVIEVARRGKISLEETRKMADVLGMSEKKLLKRRQGKAFNAEEALAARDILNQSALRLRKVQEEAARLGTDEALATFRIAMEQHAGIQAQVSGMTAEAGRALSSFRIMSQATKTEKAYKAMLDAMGGREVTEEILRRFAQIDPNNITAVNKFIAQTSKVKTMDMVYEAWISAILSGPKTQVVNIISNTLTFLTKPILETPTTATIELTKKLITGKPRERFYKEMPVQLVGTWHGFKDGVRAALKAWETELPIEAGEKIEVKVHKAIPSKIFRAGKEKKTVELFGQKVRIPLTGEIEVGGKQIRIPLRTLLMADEFFKAVIYKSEIYTQAYRKAKMEGKNIPERMAELIQEPTPEMINNAKSEARYRTFNQPLGKIGGQIMRLRDTVPFLRYVIPFVRTPANIAKFALERTPLNFPRLLWKIRKGELSGAEISEQFAKPIMGSLIAIAVIEYAKQGQITGGGPKSKEQREALYRVGWQPYSFLIGDKYYSYSRLEPMGSIVGMAADFAELSYDPYMEREADKEMENIVGRIAFSFGKNITSKTFLSGLSNVFDAISDPQRYGEKWINQFAGSVVPTGIAQYTQAKEEIIRQAETPMERIKSRLPGLVEELLPKRNIWGQEIEKPGTPITRFISPFPVSEVKEDFIDKEIVRLGLKIGMPTKKIQGVELTPEEYDRYSQKAGEKARQITEKIVKSSAYHIKNDAIKKLMIENAIKTARNAEGMRLLKTFDRSRILKPKYEKYGIQIKE